MKQHLHGATHPMGARQTSEGALRRQGVIALTAFLTVVDLFATQAILPSLAKAYGTQPAATSLAVNASTFGMAIASLAMAFVSHHIDRRSGILFALIGLAIPTLLLSIAPNLVVFAGLRIAQGLFMATAFTLMLAYLGENSSAEDTAGAFAAYIAGNVASNLVGRLLSAGLVDHFGLATNFVIFAGLNLSGALLVYFTVNRVQPMRVVSGAVSPWRAITMHLATPGLPAVFAIGFCILFAFIGTFSFVNFVLVSPPIGLGMMSIGFVYLVFLPSIVTTLFAGSVVARFGPRVSIRAGLGVAAIGAVLLLVSRLDLVIAGLGLVAVGTFFAQAVATGFVGKTAKSNRGAASGLYLASYFSGGLVGTAVLGPIFQNYGWTACVLGIVTSLAAAGMLSSRLVTLQD